MAISQADGTIILETAVDTSGVERDLSKVRQSAERVGDAKFAAKLQREFDKVSQKARDTEAEIRSIYARLDELAAGAFKAPDTGEPVYLKAEQAEVEKLTARLGELEQQLSNSSARASELASEMQNVAGAPVQNDVVDVTSQLGDASNNAGDLGENAEEATTSLMMTGVSDAIGRVGTAIEKTSKRILGLIRRVFIFTVITKALRSVRENISSVLMSNEDFRNSLYRLQAALWTAFAPIFDFVIPAIKTLIDWISSAVIAIGRFVGMLLGKSYDQLTEQGKALKQQSDNYKSVGKSAGGAAKSMGKVTDEAKKQLAAFDELNILTEENAEANANAGAGGGGAPSDAWAAGDNNIAGKVNEQLAEIIKIVGGALAALGVVLLLFGHIGYGLAFIIAGASMFVTGEAAVGGFDSGSIKTELAKLGQIFGAFLGIIGVILLMTGNLVKGISLIIAGFSIFGVSEQILDENKISTLIGAWSSQYAAELAVSGGLLLVVGITLLATGVGVPIGLGLVVAGAGLLGYGISKEPDWGAFFNLVWLQVQSDWNQILQWFEEANKKHYENLLYVYGVIGEWLEKVWSSVWGWLTETWNNIGGWLGETGKNIANWFSQTFGGIAGWLKEAWQNVVKFFKDNIAPVFTLEWWKNLARNAGNGLIAGFEAALNGVISLFEKTINWIVRSVNSIGFDIPSFLGGGHVGFNLKEVSFSRVTIPRLATGGIVPRATLAMVGENGREAVLPLENNTEWMDMLADKLLSRLGTFGGDQMTVIQLDGREFGRAVVKYGNSQNRIIGAKFTD